MEQEGFRCRSSRRSCRYLTPARYDDELEIHTRATLLTPARVRFDYEVRLPAAANRGHGPHGARRAGRGGKPCRLPDRVRREMVPAPRGPAARAGRASTIGGMLKAPGRARRWRWRPSLAACGGNRNVTPPNTGQPDRFLMDRGNEAIGKSNWVDAREYYRQVVDNYPQSPLRPDAKLGIGETYLGEGPPSRWSRRQRVPRVPHLLPHQPQGRPGAVQAGDDLREADARAGARSDARPRRRLKEFQVFFDRFPNSPLMPEVRKQWREARDRLSEASYRVGYHYYRQRWYPGAVDRFREVLRDDPEYSEARRRLFLPGGVAGQEPIRRPRPSRTSSGCSTEFAAERARRGREETPRRARRTPVAGGVAWSAPVARDEADDGPRGPLRSSSRRCSPPSHSSTPSAAPSQRSPAIAATHVDAEVLALACAPVATATTPPTATLRITGGQDTDPRRIYAQGDLVTVNAGSNAGHAGRPGILRPPPAWRPRGIAIVAQNARHDPAPPAGSASTPSTKTCRWPPSPTAATPCRSATTSSRWRCPSPLQGGPAKGKPERDNYARVMLGNDRRTEFGQGDYLVIDRGSGAGDHARRAVRALSRRRRRPRTSSRPRRGRGRGRAEDTATLSLTCRGTSITAATSSRCGSRTGPDCGPAEALRPAARARGRC